MQITICGGGNAAHTLAGLLSSQTDHSVRIFAPLGDEAKRWQDGVLANHGISVHTPDGLRKGIPNVISSDPGEAVGGSELVILALPAFAHQTILEQISPYLRRNAWVGALPARGGFDLGARAALRERMDSVSIFGFQTLPWACRIQQYGREALILGAKEQVDIAVWPSSQASTITVQLQQLLQVRLNTVGSFLSLTLADTGQIIHPGIMYGLFHDWDGQPYPIQKLFYQAVDEDIAATLQQMSDEIQNLRSNIEMCYPEMDLSAVRLLGEWLLRSYRSSISDPSTLHSSFASNQGYAGLTAPMKAVPGGFVPDFQARYLAEDVPYDLLVTRGIAELASVSTPKIDQVLEWAQTQLNKKYLINRRLQGADLSETRAPQRFSIASLDQLVRQMGYMA